MTSELLVRGPNSTVPRGSCRGEERKKFSEVGEQVVLLLLSGQDCGRDRTAVRSALAAPLLCAPLRSSACQRRMKAARAAAGCAQQDGAAAEEGRAWLQNKSTKASKVGKQASLNGVNCAEGERELRLKHLGKK